MAYFHDDFEKSYFIYFTFRILFLNDKFEKCDIINDNMWGGAGVDSLKQQGKIESITIQAKKYSECFHGPIHIILYRE